MKNLILIAPPAAGKGTISEYLVENENYMHISTGDILRNVANSDTDMGRKVKELIKEGKFIGDEIILPLFKEELIKLKDKPFILDGMPRTIHQAEYLTELFQELNVNNYVVINMEIEESLLEKRAVGRRICTCGASYNIYFDDFKPQEEGICDKCKKELIQREDDTAETFKMRFKTYLNETEPLIHYYKEKGLLETVNANNTKNEIIKDVKSILGSD